MFHPAPSAENEEHPTRCQCPEGGVLDVHLHGKCPNRPEHVCRECGRHVCDICGPNWAYTKQVAGEFPDEGDEKEHVCIGCFAKYAD